MNTDFNFIPDSFEFEEDQHEYLFNKLRGQYCRHSIYEWKRKLEELTNVIIDCDDGAKLTKNDMKPFISEIKNIIEEAWCVLVKRDKIGFEHEYLGIEWKSNPYALKKVDVPETHQYRTSFRRVLEDKVTLLSAREVRNFLLVFEDFFKQLDVVNWLRLLDKWNEYSSSGGRIMGDGYDCTPLETARQLQRLMEACHLMDDFVMAPRFYPPNSHLFDTDFMILECYTETYNGYNPFLLLAQLYSRYNLTELKEEFSHWMYCAKNKEEIYNQNEPARLIILHSSIIKLYEIGWLILYTPKMPKHFLKPTKMDEDFDIGEVNFNEEPYSHLNEEEQNDPKNALHGFYSMYNLLRYQRLTLKSALYYALQTKHEYYSIERFEEVELKTNKIMEILYVLNREFIISNYQDKKKC